MSDRCPECRGTGWHKPDCSRRTAHCMHRHVTMSPDGWMHCDDCGRSFHLRGSQSPEGV